MKLFSIFNKPHTKVDNKQRGVVFLEYVIMAFIATVAIICAIWWLYWHLQQLTWEIKDRLNNLPRTCPLETPYGASPESQPLPTFTWKLTEEQASGLYNWFSPASQPISYPDQKVIIKNIGDAPDYTYIYFIDFDPGYWQVVAFFATPSLNPGDEFEAEYHHTGAGPYRVGLAFPYEPYSITVSPISP